MTDVTGVPDWLGAAVVGALIAALGYVAKLGIEGLSTWRRERAARISQLLDLASLLQASREAFLVQQDLVYRLEDLLRASHPGVMPDRSGYERHFSQAFAQFTPDEAELHALIRSMTTHSLRPLNQAMSEWLRADRTYRTARGEEGTRGMLAQKLNRLDTHLRLWLAKYEAWIPPSPPHALVYLADEEEHGIGFPPGLDQIVDKVLRGLKASVAPNPRMQPTNAGGAGALPEGRPPADQSAEA